MYQLETHPYRREVLLLFAAALLLFIFTVVVGILNGTDLVDLNRADLGHLRVLLTHVHVGTLGWITTSVFAATIWLFAPERPPSGWRAAWPRVGAIAAVAAITAYGLAFLTSTGWARPVLGSLTAAVILVFFIWAVVQARTLTLSVPHWGMLVALATSVTGGVLGVLWGILIASEQDIKTLPKDGEDAHPATMVVGFLIPVAVAMIEWGLRRENLEKKAPRAGFIQMVLLFLAGLSLMLGVLLDVVPLIMLNLPLEIAAVVIFLVRLWPAFRTVGFSEGQPPPYFTASAIALVVNIGMLFYLLSKYADDFDAVPTHLLLALDHLMFVGVITNSLFGLLLMATAVRRTVMPWADKLVFWGVNIGIAGFWAGFLADSDVPKRVFTPILGVAILLGVAMYLLRIRDDAQRRAVEASATASG